MLTLYRGDDYAGQLGKTLTIHLSLDAGLPIEGLKAVFEFYDIKKEFTPIQYENDFVIEVSHNQSKKYPLGVSYGKLYCVDSAGKIRTFCNRIPICVTTNLQKVYGSDGLDKQDVHVYALVHWDNIAGKPNYYPSTIEEVEGLEEALRQAGKVKTVNNIEPDENGNIQIEIPSCKVISVNGKEGVVILNAGDIGYGDDRTVDSALAEAEENIKTNADNIDSLGQQVTEHIDNTYTKSEVDDKINQNAAHYLTKRTGTEGHYTYPQFATHADLAAAKAAHTEANPQFFYGIEGHTPDKNDYCVVLADETHGGATTRYAFVGEWDDNGYFRYQYTINQTAFTEEQWAAINSLTSVDEDGNLCFDGIPFINSSGELLFTEDDPIFTAWKNEVQIILGSNASVASGKYKQIAIGAHAQANGQNAIAIGSSEPGGGKTNGPRATAQNAIAIGAGAIASAVNAIQILAGTNNTSGTMQIGNKRVAFVSDIPISHADIDDYSYYKGHWDMSVTYKTGDIVRAERTVEGQTAKEVTYFKSLKDNNRANNPFSTPTYWSVTTDDEGLEKLTLFVKAAIATLTGADIPVSPTNTDKIDVALGKKIGYNDDHCVTMSEVKDDYAYDYDQTAVGYTFSFSSIISHTESGTVKYYRVRRSFTKTANGWNQDKTSGQLLELGAHGTRSVTTGIQTAVSGYGSSASGEGSFADGIAANAEGRFTIVEGNYAHAEGMSTKATGDGAHSEGNGTLAEGEFAHAEGVSSYASGTGSNAKGYSAVAKDIYSSVFNGNGNSKDSSLLWKNVVKFVEGVQYSVGSKVIYHGFIFTKINTASSATPPVEKVRVGAVVEVSYKLADDYASNTEWALADLQPYMSHGAGTFNANPNPTGTEEELSKIADDQKPLTGFFVGEKNLHEHISAIVASNLSDKLTDDDLKTLCTACGISLTKPDGTQKTRAELLTDLFGESNSQLKATIEANAVIFLETDGTVIKRGSERIKKFADLLALVQTGRVVLKSTATTSLNSSPVLFRPQLMNSDTILFDATGDISGIMRTRNIKVTKAAVETEEGVDIVVTNGNLQTLIRESDLNARLPYALVSPTDNTIRNRSVNAFTMNGDFSPAFPSPTTGYARDFLINLTVTTAGSFELPEGISSKGDDLSFESGKKYLIAMTEYEARKFLVKLLDVTEA